MATKSKELNIEDKLWKTADALRGSMDASEYRNVVLGLIFLKYVSDSFEMRHEELLKTDYPEDAEDPDMYLSENIFWVPQEARWSLIQKSAKTPQVGEIIIRSCRRNRSACPRTRPPDGPGSTRRASASW